MPEPVVVPTFHKLLAQLAAEYERAESALANALAELRTFQEQDDRNGAFAGGSASGPPNIFRATSSGAASPTKAKEECGAWDDREGHTDHFQDSMHDEKVQVFGDEKEQGKAFEAAPCPNSPTPEKVVTFGPAVLTELSPRPGAKRTLPRLATCGSEGLRHCKPPADDQLEDETWQAYMTSSTAYSCSADADRDSRAPVDRPRRISMHALFDIFVLPLTIRPKLPGTRWVINPEHSQTLERWDQVTLIALAYVALVTPVQVSMLESKLDAMLAFNCFIDFIFFCDMILQFFLMYPRRANGVITLERHHSKIVLHYLRTWFPIDLFSTLPFDLFAALSDSQEAQQLKLVKTVRLMRLLKLLRVVKASRVMVRLETRLSITYGRLALVKFFVILSVITHWLANLWALTLVLVDANEGVPRWVDALTALEEDVEVKTKDSPAKLYVACLYFTSYTITSVGYGDIGPKNIVERVVLIIIIIGSGISWAVVLGQVCGIIANLDKDECVFRSTMDELNAMMQDRVIPKSMQMRLRSFFLSNKTAQKRIRHRHLVAAMSAGLRGEVTWEINRTWLENISFLRPLLPDPKATHHDTESLRSLRPFVFDMTMVMEQMVCAQNEIFGVLHTMYILNRGLIGRLGRVWRSGAVWGADFVLSDRGLLEPVQSCALTYIEFTTIDRRHFFDIVRKHARGFPDIYKVVRRYCCWLAFQRALMLEARRRRAKLREQEFLADSEGYDVPDDERERR